MAGAERRPLEQSEDDAAQAEDGESRTAPIDPPRTGWIAALLHESERQRQHDDRERHVQKEHRAPAGVLDEPAAAHRADRRGNRAEYRPRADRAAAPGVVERGADDREAARNQERGTHALQRATSDQDARGSRDAAANRRRRE